MPSKVELRMSVSVHSMRTDCQPTVPAGGSTAGVVVEPFRSKCGRRALVGAADPLLPGFSV